MDVILASACGGALFLSTWLLASVLWYRFLQVESERVERVEREQLARLDALTRCDPNATTVVVADDATGGGA